MGTASFCIGIKTMPYWTYVLKSKSDGKLYIGSTADLERRLERHNSGRVTSTKGGVPWDIIGHFEHKDRAQAVRMEKKLKSWKNPSKVIAFLIEIGKSKED
ncbi:hypothetical protein CEE37_06835 [candidate division LCP-89 bacterium B3_LCP]|uniref:GIY-YIG domain-containing protein n=1 Tax=candidate division LCP-89 bacterium B3_LCP TaxID=2012998 RepID=A0A532V0K8_UNCL8|nr:MAG: hypothetical protein CEE37_06835 [candidate division LCP-89 bacterium B3_LCP]